MYDCGVVGHTVHAGAKRRLFDHKIVWLVNLRLEVNCDLKC